MAIERSADDLLEDPAPASVLFFHGNGGNGTSLLLRHLRRHCCKRLSGDNWDYLAALPDEVLANGLEATEGTVPVPSAALDFGLGTEDVVGLLRELRRALAAHGFTFPRFTYARVQYWQQAGGPAGSGRNDLPQEPDRSRPRCRRLDDRNGGASPRRSAGSLSL